MEARAKGARAKEDATESQQQKPELQRPEPKKIPFMGQLSQQGNKKQSEARASAAASKDRSQSCTCPSFQSRLENIPTKTPRERAH